MVSHYFESHRSGIELVAGRLAQELAILKEDVVWLASKATPPPPQSEVHYRTVSISALNVTERYLGIPFPFPSLGAICEVRQEVHDADVVLLHDCLYPVCVAAFLFALRFRKPLVITQHVGIIPYNNPVFRTMMELANKIIARPMLARADRVAFVSEITAWYFRGVRFRSAPKLIFNGVDTDIFFPVTSERKLQLRGDLALPLDRHIVLFVGRFVEKKGLHILSRMVRLRPDLVWAFAGWGPMTPGDWGLPNVMIFSSLSGASIGPLYQASDVLVLPSKGEGFPLVIQEALACGLPVVCGAETAGADAAVSAFLSGVPLDEQNPRATALAFCAEIDRIFADGHRGGLCGDERFRFVSQRYSWSSSAAQYLDLIRSAAANPEPWSETPRSEGVI
jgi:glycosyltransferase involved in cell wall biosynthesis